MMELENTVERYKKEEGGKIYDILITPTKDKQWYYKGQLHRENGPAVEVSNGGERWLRYGQLHREDGPAIIYADGNKGYYLFNTWYTYNTWKEKVEPLSKKNIINELLKNKKTSI